MKLFPMEEGSLLITVNNEDPQPIEVQLHSGLFRKGDAWKWGACLSTFFSFKYSVQFNRFFQVQILNLHDEKNQMERVATVTMRCHYSSCIGLAEFEREDVDGCGDLHIHIEV